MKNATLVLVQIENSDEVFAAAGEASLEIFLGEFEERVQCFARSQDETLKVQPHKLCIILKGVCDPIQIELAAAKLTRLFEAPIRILDEEFKAKIHAAFVPPTSEKLDVKSRLRVAESGLGEARKEGKTYVVQGSIAAASVVAVKRTREIELAFGRGEFVMYFQPQVHSGFRNVIGAEALMRWHHPERGVLPPGEFMPFVAQSAVMRELTWFAIKSSVAQAVRWPDEISVAVNISPVLLHDDELVSTVEDALSIFELRPQRFTLEITEDAIVENPEKTRNVLHQMRKRGIRISIDDFGTGYSSLEYFRELPVDELKIDRSFVSHMLDKPRDHDIVKSIIDLSHTLGMKVVAEGVEDNETADALQSLGADLLQGFWFGKPVERTAFEKLLT